MPLNVAVEDPDARIIRSKTNNKVSLRTQNQSVSAHWCGGEYHASVVQGFSVPITGIIVRSHKGLESVTVQMERMLASVVVVHHNFINLVVTQNKGVSVCAVDLSISGQLSGAECSVERWYLGFDVGDIVEEGIVLEGISMSSNIESKQGTRLRLHLQDCP